MFQDVVVGLLDCLKVSRVRRLSTLSFDKGSCWRWVRGWFWWLLWTWTVSAASYVGLRHLDQRNLASKSCCRQRSSCRTSLSCCLGSLPGCSFGANRPEGLCVVQVLGGMAKDFESVFPSSSAKAWSSSGPNRTGAAAFFGAMAEQVHRVSRLVLRLLFVTEEI